MTISNSSISYFEHNLAWASDNLINDSNLRAVTYYDDYLIKVKYFYIAY